VIFNGNTGDPYLLLHHFSVNFHVGKW